MPADPRENMRPGRYDYGRAWRFDPAIEELAKRAAAGQHVEWFEADRIAKYHDQKAAAVEAGFEVGGELGSAVDTRMAEQSQDRVRANDKAFGAWQPDAAMERALDMRAKDPAAFEATYEGGGWDVAWYERGKQAHERQEGGHA